jgi:hypothetical protein
MKTFYYYQNFNHILLIIELIVMELIFLRALYINMNHNFQDKYTNYSHMEVIDKNNYIQKDVQLAHSMYYMVI